LVYDDRIMGTLYTRPYGFQIRITNKLLPKDLWATFDTRDAAEQYMQQLEALLAEGIVPAALLERGNVKQEIWTVQRCILEYVKNNPVPLSDRKLLDTLMPGVATVPTSALNYEWAEAWIRDMKRIRRLAPSTIRHRHGALARCFDWVVRKHSTLMLQNPLRLLKRGFATYTPADAAELAKRGLEIRVDEERDRRIDPDEEARILGSLPDQSDERILFELARDTAMRMRECYTLDITQVVLRQRTIHLDRTKNGDKRQVPLPTPTVELLSAYMSSRRDRIASRTGRLFPFGPATSTKRSSTRRRRSFPKHMPVFSRLRVLKISTFTTCATRPPAGCMSELS
jgi:integrase